MEAQLKLLKDSAVAEVDTTLYRSLVGSLRYLVHTRSDISFVVGYVSRFMENPRQDHLVTVKHLLRYISSTIDYGILYSKRGSGELCLTGYSDSDFRGDVDDRKSTTGIVFFLDDMPISWQSQKQRVVAFSSCEAEYIAGAAAACQGVWLGRLLGDMIGTTPRPPRVKMDNMSAIALSKNPILHHQSKHINMKFHYIRECVDSGRISLDFTSS
ncbi:secreted RxLR effector protein 161-like [Phragmites australis]|uniref:secreted RxLR effector protein 161-like n=1 Tax=Phragmites australis TaxID=29695 RepID=UPI002D767501|nr:secreted RxLR effector protein 161-like [Phragmites australis]